MIDYDRMSGVTMGSEDQLYYIFQRFSKDMGPIFNENIPNFGSGVANPGKF